MVNEAQKEIQARREREFAKAERNPQIKVMEGICGRMAQSFRRHYHDLELAQAKRDGIEGYAAEFVAELQKFFTHQFSKKYSTLPVFFQGQGEIPTDGDCWLVHIGGSAVNLEHGREDVHIVMAYVSEGRARSACVFFPLEDRFYSVAYGEGAHTPDLRMRTSAREELTNTITGVFSPVSKDENSEAYMKLIKHVRTLKMHLRTSGSPVWDMIQVASGKADSYFGLNLSTHEVLIGRLFMEEAGAKVTDLGGEAITAASTTIVAGNEKIQPKALALIS